MSENEQTVVPAQGVSRRTVTKAMAWSVPVIAVAGTAPRAAASLLPCVGQLTPVGGTYPVTVNLSGCNNSTANPNHWDFNFRITVAEQTGTECDCDAFRVTFYDNPRRSRLGIQGGAVFDDWGTDSNNSPRMYIQKELPPGGTATFPAEGDRVYRVAPPYTGHGVPGDYNLTITAPGTANDSVHALYTAGGGIPCGASGPFAQYTIECRKGSTYTQLGGIGDIDPCIPMIQASVTCRVNNSGSNGRYRLAINVVNNSCSSPSSKFHVTNIYRNDNTNFPNQGGNTVWTGDQVVGGGTTIEMASSGNSGDQLWISFHTGDPSSTSRIRVQIPGNVGTCPNNLQSSNDASTESTTDSTGGGSKSTSGSGSTGSGSGDTSGGSGGSSGGSGDTSGGSSDSGGTSTGSGDGAGG